ncbi:MAG: wax ester/triacylglycerol synthase family O-acyltransferase [Halioglobus sp.]
MKQLGILDSAFVNLEQTNTPQHVGGLGIYDPSTAPGGLVRFKQVISTFERRLDQQPRFRTRLVEVPGGLDRPYWVKDEHFDMEFHLRHIALPHPGDWRQLCIQVARLHSRPLDMKRPLWEAYIIEGLDNIPNLPKGSFAIYSKLHHAMVDGVGGSSFIPLLHDLVPDPPPEEASMEPRLVDSEPSVSELLTKASVNSVKNGLGLVRETLSTGSAFARYAVDVMREDVPAPDLGAPKTSLNQAVGPYRVFDAAEFSLDSFKQIKNAQGVKVNDVAMTIVGGALQRYLQAKGEQIDGALTANVPLNMRTRRDVTDENNQVGAVFASLHSDLTDPLERLAAVHQSTEEAKEFGEKSPMVDVLKVAGLFAPVFSKTVAGIWARNHLSRHLPLNVSTVVSNVTGPDFPLYCAGARMVDYYGLGLLTPGMGLFHTVFSYSGTVTLSVLGDRNIMPDPEFYHDCLIASYEELYRAAVPTSKPAAGKRTKRGKAAGSDNKVTATQKKPKAKAAVKKASSASKPKVKSKPGTRVKAKTSTKPKTKPKMKPKKRQNRS